jgi:hypothetical protein
MSLSRKPTPTLSPQERGEGEVSPCSSVRQSDAAAAAAHLTDEQIRATVLGKADAPCWSNGLDLPLEDMAARFPKAAQPSFRGSPPG